MKLTKAQRQFLRDVRGVDGMPPEVLIGGERPMANRLADAGLIVLSNAHPVTGRMHQAFHLTDAGRAALEQGS
jgi:hypothetical protein